MHRGRPLVLDSCANYSSRVKLNAVRRITQCSNKKAAHASHLENGKLWTAFRHCSYCCDATPIASRRKLSKVAGSAIKGAVHLPRRVYRRLVKMALADLQLMEQQIGQLDQEIASLLREHQDAVQRLAEVPGLGVDSAQQIIAEVGAKAATFPSAKNLVSWVGACPGEEESAGVNRSKRSPKGNRQMRRILNQAANAAAKHKGSIFEIVYRRLVLRLGHHKTIGAIAHRLCQLIWIILHNGARYEERGPTVCERAKRARTSRMIRTLRILGYRVEPLGNPA